LVFLYDPQPLPAIWRRLFFGHPSMTSVDAHVVRFQRPKCGAELEQTKGQIKSSEHMRCQGCGVGISIDADRLSNAADEIQKAIEKVPSEITIKFYR
jgi:predicted RNA-binding Zn-ribbon protein involved in translation (DUF1610 family)